MQCNNESWWHLSAEGVSALVAVIAAIWAIVAQTRESRRSRIATGFDVLARLNDQFEGSGFRRTRKQAALYLSLCPDDDASGDDAAMSILNFFEGVAYPWKKGLVDTEAIWHSFGAWLLPYYRATDAIRARERGKDRDAFTDMDELYEAVKAFKSKKFGKTSVDPLLSDSAIREFLTDESNLVTGPQI